MQGEIFHWLQTRFKAQCDGQWEHRHGFKIETTDNPGWWVTLEFNTSIDLTQCILPRKEYRAADDWLETKIEAQRWMGAGDPGKLEALLKLAKLELDGVPGLR